MVMYTFELKKECMDDGYVYARIEKGVYGLKQAAVLAYNNLVKILKKYGYEPCPNTKWYLETQNKKNKICFVRR